MTKRSVGPEHLCFCHCSRNRYWIRAWKMVASGCSGDSVRRRVLSCRWDLAMADSGPSNPAMAGLWPELRLATCTKKQGASAGGGGGGLPWPEWRLPTKQTDWCTAGSHDQTLGWGLYAFKFVKKFPTEQPASSAPQTASFKTLNGTMLAKGKYN